MAELFGGDYIYSAISSDTDLAELVGTNIFNARLIPSDATGTETINFYITAPVNYALPHFEARWSINCRASIESTALQIADRVAVLINRVFGSVDSHAFYATVSMLAPIPPVDDTDAYNVPVEIYLRRR